MNISQTESSEQFLLGGGEMGKLIRSMDWSKTALGPIETWPQSLRTTVSLCLSSTFPILIAWGPETIQIYNDSYRPICGAKHPESMGQNFRICWETALPVVGDAFTRGQQGEGTYIKDQRMFLDRYGYLEESFMTFSFAPIRDESGEVGGIFHPITESTEKMLSARRTQSLRDLGAAIGKAKSVHEIAGITIQKYSEYVLDLPFILLYQFNADEQTATLIGNAGLDANSIMAPTMVDTSDQETVWPFYKVLETAQNVVVDDLVARFGEFNCEPYPETPINAVLIPVRISGQDSVFGFLVAGVSARRALDDAYLNFYELLGGTFNTAVTNVYAYEQEQKRAEALAAIDRSKTAFFNNVSHEFRTPLTLMLGPLEELLSQPDLQNPGVKENIDATYRNTLRLLKLVNNLLDYSRVEAGRVQALYQPVDLASLTADLASSFRSIIEKAEMELVVNCPPMDASVYVDGQMWEKIVLNLLSNAFKYTLQGSIKVELKQQQNFAVLQVIDTGVGIPAKELPHMFERFHRIENTAGRTHEGTGIGLSLVHELVNLHHGEITVESVEGVGSTFTVKIPLGKSHLPAAQISGADKLVNSSTLKGAFIKEASSLLDTNDEMAGTTEATGYTSHYSEQSVIAEDKDTRILVVDDNADMRAYITRLLSPYFTIQTAVNGLDALEKITTEMPDLVVSDIMMPVMDGKQLLQHIRDNAITARLPVVFLSARAGEEARIDGLEAGADDYLVKPFSGKELLTKIVAQIKINKARNQAEQMLRALFLKAPVAISVYRGTQHVIEVANDMMLSYWGRSAEETLGKPLFEAIPELEGQGFDQIMERVYTYNERFVLDETPVNLIRYGTPETIYIKLTVEPLHDQQGNVNGMMAVAHDVHELVLSRQQAQDTTAEVQALMRKKDEFMSIASHELKTPLTSMKGYLQLLERMVSANTDNRLTGFVGKANRQADKLTELVNELLDVTKIQAGKLELTKTDFPIKDLLEDYIEHRHFTDTQHAILIEGDLDTIITGDQSRLEQVVNNLISNAIKYSPDGDSVVVKVTTNDHQIKISVTDYGIGIPPNKIQYLFDRFYRVEETVHNISGLGLGLYISSVIIERHNGQIGVESAVGKGSTFWFTLPLL
ncbi:ATP-binding protein [Mucilaginibacter lacusdianchii]|uniref:ATP-binding protein n=1 Tax=Mucilaginibacter lacusdianchii TaxID=2684211 RepID=UPI0018EEDCF0|nr:ATP-binding protein [Mucilaginibacter sp. JXJ CY 39]